MTREELRLCKKDEAKGMTYRSNMAHESSHATPLVYKKLYCYTCSVKNHVTPNNRKCVRNPKNPSYQLPTTPPSMNAPMTPSKTPTTSTTRTNTKHLYCQYCGKDDHIGYDDPKCSLCTIVSKVALTLQEKGHGTTAEGDFVYFDAAPVSGSERNHQSQSTKMGNNTPVEDDIQDQNGKNT